MTRVLTLGEIMLRLSSPGHERLFQSPNLQATFGGGEANVAVSLAALGIDAGLVTVLPEGPIGEAAIAELRRHGVDTSQIVRSGERVGIYFLEKGSDDRPSVVVYDAPTPRSAKPGLGASTGTPSSTASTGFTSAGSRRP
jgi:2-dehydro-3-deoxygluconokinase